MPATETPEARARRAIDVQLGRTGWIVQDRGEMNVHASRGVAVREFPLAAGHGAADYMLFVDGRAVGVLEAKPEGHTLSGVEVQADRYARGLPRELKTTVRPLPFLYLSTGAITRFTNLLESERRTRERAARAHPRRTRGTGRAADEACAPLEREVTRFHPRTEVSSHALRQRRG